MRRHERRADVLGKTYVRGWTDKMRGKIRTQKAAGGRRDENLGLRDVAGREALHLWHGRAMNTKMREEAVLTWVYVSHRVSPLRSLPHVPIPPCNKALAFERAFFPGSALSRKRSI